MPRLDQSSQARLDALSSATLDRWIALSADESHVVAESETFEGVVEAAELSGESDPLILRVPDNWMPRILW